MYEKILKLFLTSVILVSFFVFFNPFSVLATDGVDPEVGARFFVFGHVYPDYAAVEQALSDIQREQPDFVIFLGDTLAPQHQIEWDEILAITDQITVPVYFAAGNHDIEDRADDRRQYSESIGPLRYAFEKGGISFTVLSSSQGVPLGSFDVGKEDVALIQQKLETSVGPHIVFVHHCLFYTDDGELCNNRGQLVSPESTWNREVVPLLKNHDVLGVFVGDVGSRHPYLHYIEDEIDYFGVGFSTKSLRYPPHYLDVTTDGDDMVVEPVIIRKDLMTINSLEPTIKSRSFKDDLGRLSYERFRIIAITYSKKLAFGFAVLSVFLGCALLLSLYRLNKKP
jgi:predicted phosphodiesterase